METMYQFAILSAAHSHTQGYLNSINKHANIGTAIIWDDVEERGRRFAKEFNGEYSADLDATVNRTDIDGFIICSENSRHLPLLKAAIPTGKPIFCEKPLTTSTVEAAEILSLVRASKSILHAGYFQPFSAELQGVADLVQSGKLGKITHARYRNAHSAAYGRWFDSPDRIWFSNPELAGGGAFMDMGTHAVHLLRTLLGPVEKVFATVSNVSGIYPEVDDNGLALLRFRSGCLGTVEASWVQVDGPKGLEISGSEAVLFQEPDGDYVASGMGDSVESVPEGIARPTRVDRLIAVIEGEVTQDELEKDLNCAADAVSIMEACYKSNGSGRWVEVKDLYKC